MKYPTNKPIQYLSPSSYMEYETCPAKFCTKRLCGFPRTEGEQGVPAALGSAFDMYVKRWIGHKLGLVDAEDKMTRPDLTLYALDKQISVDIDRKEEIKQAAQNISSLYIKLQFAKRLMDEGINDVEIDSYHIMDLHPEFTGPPIRLFGKLDGSIAGIVPFDWKVRGYGSKNGYSPTPGYRVYVTSDGRSMEAHYKQRAPIHELNDRWGIQLTMYSWMLNKLRHPVKEMDVAIDEVTYGKSNIVFTQIRTITTLDYQMQLWYNISKAWVELNNMKHVPIALPGHQCFMYNLLCEVAHLCPEYVQLKEFEYSQIKEMQ